MRGGTALVGIERYAVTLKSAFHYRGILLLLPCKNGDIAVAVPLLHNKSAYLRADKIALAVAVRRTVHRNRFTVAVKRAADVPQHVPAVKSQLGSFKALRLFKHNPDRFHIVIRGRSCQPAHSLVYRCENRILGRFSVCRRQTDRHTFALGDHHVKHSVLVGGKASERVYKHCLSLEISVPRRPCRRFGNISAAVLIAAL